MSPPLDDRFPSLWRHSSAHFFVFSPEKFQDLQINVNQIYFLKIRNQTVHNLLTAHRKPWIYSQSSRVSIIELKLQRTEQTLFQKILSTLLASDSLDYRIIKKFIPFGKWTNFKAVISPATSTDS